MDIVLIGGLWLGPSAWDDVAVRLVQLGHRPLPVALPGQGDGNTAATHDDQVTAVLAAVDSADSPVVVGHSASSTLAWIAADRRPDSVRAVAMIGGFPTTDGAPFDGFFTPVDGAVAFPGWEAFEGPDSADLDEATRERFAADAIPVPAGVATGTVRLTDDRRYDTPTVLVCPEYSPADLTGWIEAGEIPELARVKRITYVDIDSGHWPMITKPDELAQIIDDVARANAPA